MAAKGKRSLAARVGDFLQASTAGDDGSVDESDVSDEDEFGRASSLERQAGFYPAARDPARAYAPETGKEPGGQKSGAELSSADKAKAIKEVEEFAVYLGMDLAEDRDLLWVAVEAMTAPLPENWSEHNTRNGQPYYYNKRTDHTQWEHPMDEYHRGLYKKLKAEKLKGKTQQQLALAKDEIAHHFAADAARAAADGMSGPRRKSNIVVGNGGMAGAKPGKAADAGLSAGEATAAAQGQGKSSAHKENTKPGSSGKARQVVSVALDSAAMTSPLSSGTAGSTPASSPNDAESAASTQQAAAQRQEELKRKQDKKARLRSKLAAIKGVDAAAGSSEVGSLSPEEKQRLKEREQEKLKSMLQLVKEQRRVAGTLNPRNQPAGGQLDPLLIIGGANAGPAGPAGLARQTSLMGNSEERLNSGERLGADHGRRLGSAGSSPLAAPSHSSPDLIQVPLVGAKVREKIRHFEENLTVGAQRDHVGKAQAAVPLQPPQPAHLPPSGRISRLARPITPDDEEGAT